MRTTSFCPMLPTDRQSPQYLVVSGEVLDRVLQRTVELADPLGVIEKEAESVAEMALLETAERIIEDLKQGLEVSFQT